LALGAALVVEKQVWIGKGLKAKGLVKGWGHLRFYYRDGEEIVALDRGAYSEKFGKWRGFLNRVAVRSFGIQAESYSVDWLG
jgi:hypothetical protein